VRRIILVLGLMCLMAAAVSAQKVTMQYKCAKPADTHSIDVGDAPGHAYAISQDKCTAASGELGGVRRKEGTGTNFSENTGNASKFHGTFIETLANGDKIHYGFEGSGTTKNGQFVTAMDKWWVNRSTGKFKGAKGEGTCKGKGNADGSVTWDCEGTYHMASAAPAKAPAKK